MSLVHYISVDPRKVDLRALTSATLILCRSTEHDILPCCGERIIEDSNCLCCPPVVVRKDDSDCLHREWCEEQRLYMGQPHDEVS